MKILTSCMVSALALSAVTSAYAADANKAVVTRDWSDTVAPADQNAYEDPDEELRHTLSVCRCHGRVRGVCRPL